MAKLTERELTQLRLILMDHLELAFQDINRHDLIPGHWPDEIVSLMTDASLNVIKTVSGVNDYIESSNLLK